MMIDLSPRQSGKFIAERSQYVKINMGKCRELAELVCCAITDNSIVESGWHANHVKRGIEKDVNWCFFSNVINFSFWSEECQHFQFTYQNMIHTGYFACCALMNRAIDEKSDLTNCSFYQLLTLEKLTVMFTGDNYKTLPMLKERFDCLIESAKVLSDKYDGSFLNCIKKSDCSAMKLLKIIVGDFKSFQDRAMYKNQEVWLLKRAQILISDVYDCLQGNAPANFKDIGELTMFADYRVPQVLAYFGALEYNKDLMDILKHDKLLENGNEMEVEIRGCSIYAIEHIVNDSRKILSENNIGFEVKCINAATVDYFLWFYRRKHAQKIEARVPYHKTRCIYY